MRASCLRGSGAIINFKSDVRACPFTYEWSTIKVSQPRRDLKKKNLSLWPRSFQDHFIYL